MDPKVINELLDGAQLFQKRRDLKDWQKIPKTVFLSNLALWLGLDIKEFFKEDRFDEEAFLTEAIERLKKIHEGQLPPANIPPNLEELREEWEAAQREHQAFLEKEGKEPSPKEQIELWIEKQKEIYQQRQLEKATQITGEKIRAKRTYQVVVPKKPEETKKEKEKGEQIKSSAEELRAWVEKRLARSLPSLQEEKNAELKEDIAKTIGEMLKAYLPEISSKETKKLSVKNQERIATACRHALLDALALPISDQLAAENREIESVSTRQLIENFPPDPHFPHTFSPLSPLLTLSKEDRFPEEYTGSKKIAPEEAEGGLALLFLPEKVRLAVLKAVTYPFSSSLQENPEAALSLTNPNTDHTYREDLRMLLLNKGVSPQSYPTIRILTKEVRSLRLLSLGITPEILSQTINQQLTSGAAEASSVIKILRILHQDLLDFEKEIGFPVRLIRLRALAERKIRQVEKPIQVGLQQVYPPKRPLEAYRGWRQKARVWAIDRGIYEVQAKEGERVRVENRLLRPLTRPIEFVYRRAVRPILVRLGKTTMGRTIKLGWSKVKGTTAKAFWRISKEGFKKVAKKGVSSLATKFAATKIGAALGTVFPVIGNAIGAVIGFVVDIGLGLLKKTVGKLFGFLKGLVSWSGKKGQRVIYGFSDFMQQITSGETFFNSKALKLIFILVFGLLFTLGIFEVTIEPGAALITELVPTETRYLGPLENLPGRIPMESQKLSEIFTEAANKYCVPIEILFAISQMEASGVWGYTADEVAKFSTPDWWGNEGCKMDEKVPGDCARGYCYDTCKVADLCPRYSVVGPMQFEEGAWNGYVASLKADFEEEGDPHEPHRCNLRDSIFAAAMKIKANSGTDDKNCTDWSDDIVRATARAYCGSCGWEEECGANPTPECKEQHRACGQNYCAAVVILYNEYK